MKTSRAARYTVLEPSEEAIVDIVKDVASALLPHGKTNGPGSSGPLNLESTRGPIDALVEGKPAFYEDRAAGSHQNQPGSPHSVAISSTSAIGKEESLSDVDEDELEAYLLDEDERKHKSDIWHEVNKDYLEEWHVRGQEARRKKRRAEDSAKDSVSDTGSRATSGSGSKRSRRLFPPASSCTQSAIMALTKKGRVGPERINIQALESLLQD
jgi:hypothetical protein